MAQTLLELYGFERIGDNRKLFRLLHKATREEVSKMVLSFHGIIKGCILKVLKVKRCKEFFKTIPQCTISCLEYN